MNTPQPITQRVDTDAMERLRREFNIPRIRDLEVRDDHVLYLLTLVADDLLAKRRRGEEAGLVALEMQAVLNEMVGS